MRKLTRRCGRVAGSLVLAADRRPRRRKIVIYQLLAAIPCSLIYPACRLRSSPGATRTGTSVEVWSVAALRIKLPSARSIRLTAGLIMFTYASCHLISHATGLFLLNAIERIGHDIILAPWRTPLGLSLLLAAFLTHLGLGSLGALPAATPAHAGDRGVAARPWPDNSAVARAARHRRAARRAVLRPRGFLFPRPLRVLGARPADQPFAPARAPDRGVDARLHRHSHVAALSALVWPARSLVRGRGDCATGTRDPRRYQRGMGHSVALGRGARLFVGSQSKSGARR